MKVDNKFILHIKHRIFQQKGNYVISLTGHPGTGKSYGGLDLCATFDKNFDISRVCFTLEEFFELMQQDLPVGSAIMLDEAGVAGNSKKAMHSEQVAYGEILKMMRFKRNLFVITSPGFNDYIKDGRTLVDAWINFELSDQLVKMKKAIQKSFAFLRIVKLHAIKNKHYFARFNAGSGEVIDKLVFDLPERKLVLAYEKAKKNNFDNKLRENLALIKKKKLKRLVYG